MPQNKPTINELTTMWSKADILDVLLEESTIEDLRLIQQLVNVELNKKLCEQHTQEVTSTFKMYQTKNRFSLEPSENIPGGWMLIDNLDGCLIDFKNKNRAYEAAAFSRAYVKKHGDIDLASFPYSMDQPYHFESWDGRTPRPWDIKSE